MVAHMPIAITDDHQQLEATVRDLLDKRGAVRANRDLLEADSSTRPAFFDEIAQLGWLGLHVPEELGGSGFTLAELVVVVEAFGASIAPGGFVPTVVASATLIDAPADVRDRWLAGLVDGSLVAAVSLEDGITASGGAASGSVVAAFCADVAQVLLVPSGEDVLVIDLSRGATITTPHNIDPSRRSSTVTLDGASCHVLSGARRHFTDLTRTIFAAEAVGVARTCTAMAAQYAKERLQFGRPIGTYQAIKHHCANMAVETELATGLVWDAARAAVTGGDEFSYAAAAAAALAIPAADLCANLNIQVHGGIGFTWEHDAHLFLRRATAIGSIISAKTAAEDVTHYSRAGVRRERTVDLPPEAEQVREQVREFVARAVKLEGPAQRELVIAEGYAVPHWPRPYGRDADAIEQLVIEQEFKAAGIDRPNLGITAWNILTITQHGTESQIERFVLPALRQEFIFCQLFSEPDAGSDAAGVKTRATRVDGGWIVNGQKVWTSGAHLAAYGLATVRTNPDVPKHDGITTMVIDMHAPGVEVRPLKQITGSSEFNEVFFTDVFVPDDDVVGKVDAGWTVARATLGNESVSIGSGTNMASQVEAVLTPFNSHGEFIVGGSARVGSYIARIQAVDQLNLRSAHRSVAGGGPGPEGAITKLVLSENGHEAAALLAAMYGPHTAFVEGVGAPAAFTVLVHRALSIAGGTSEIKRNQIGERILGLPRDPLIK
jgi:hypothetical protein